MRGEGGGWPSGTGAWRMEGGRRRRWSCFAAAVSLLLRVGILMRSVNECWQRRGCAVEKQPPLPQQDSSSSSSFDIPFDSRIHTKCVRLVLFVPDFPFLCISCSFISDAFSFPPTQGICFYGPLISTLYSSLSCGAFNAVLRGFYPAMANIVSPSSLEAVQL